MNIPQITFTRFLASISIVVLHFGLFSWPMNTSKLSHFGGDLISAMSYFFILSGFVLVISSAKNSTLPESINSKDFWFRRFARIFPVYLLALLVFFIINFRYDPTIPLDWQIQSYYHSLFLLQSWKYKMALDINYPSWSLSVETFFYLVFPLLYFNIIRLSNKTLIVTSLISWLLNIYVLVNLKNENVPENFYKFFPVLHLSTFLIGMSFGILFIRNYDWLVSSAKNYIHAAAVVGTLFIAYTAYKDFNFYNYQHNGLLSPYYLVVIFSLSLTKGSIAKFLSSKLLVFLGAISYSVYIFQFPVYQICQKYIPKLNTMPPEAMFKYYILILLLLSSATYLCIEKPVRKYLTELYDLKFKNR